MLFPWVRMHFGLVFDKVYTPPPPPSRPFQVPGSIPADALTNLTRINLWEQNIIILLQVVI